MLYYALQILVFQILFLVVYDLLHKRETFFVWNRLYLIIMPVLSLVLPFIEVAAFATTVSNDYIMEIERVITVSSENLIATIPKETDQKPTNWWFVIYCIGMGVSLLILLSKIYKLKILKTVSRRTTIRNKNIITLPNSNQAFSFWNSIYLGDALDEESKKQILIHEIVHVEQKHSLDQLWFEFLKIIMWWNPFIYIYQSRITVLHEYIADAAVITTIGKQNYIEQLLNATFQTQEIPFVNQFFNHSLIKKRILMLQKSQSKTIAKFKYLLVIPVIGGMLIYTSCKNESNLPTDNNEQITATEKLEEDNETSNFSTDEKSKIAVLSDKKIAESKCLNQNSKYDMDLDNYLKITVGNNAEVIVDFVSITSEEIIRTVHLGKNTTYYVRNIPEDKYRLDIQYGTEYAEKISNKSCIGYFKNEKIKEIGDQIMDFHTVKTQKGLNVPSYNLKLDLSDEIANNEK